MQQWWFQIGWLTSVYLLSGEVATSIGMAGNLKGSNNVTHFSEMISGNQYYDQGILLYMKKSVKLDWFQCSSQNLKKHRPSQFAFIGGSSGYVKQQIPFVNIVQPVCLTQFSMIYQMASHWVFCLTRNISYLQN